MDVTLIKKLLKKTGISTDALLAPYFLIPYNLFNGRAFAPIRVVYEITFRCNLTYQMCPLANWKNEHGAKDIAHSTADELDTVTIKAFIDQLRAFKTKALMITGGEPFLRKDILEVLSYVKKAGIYCSVISNGTLIDSETAKSLVRIGNEVISFSLDGPAQIHNRIRGCGDSFSKIYNAIDSIQSAKNGTVTPKVNLNFTISALNQGYIDTVVDIAHDLKIEMINLLYLFYTSDNALDQTSQMLSMGRLKPENQVIADEIKQINIEVLRSSIQKAKEKAIRYKINLNFRPPLKQEEIEERFINPKAAYCSKCFYPWFETRLDPYGNIYPCSIDIPMGNIRNESLDSIWNNAKYRNFRNTLRKHKLLPACAKCCKLNNKFWSYLPTVNC